MATGSSKPLQRRHIEALVAVADNRSVHGAARRLAIPQPAVSRLLGEAERLLGMRLVDRSSHGSGPTAQGEAVLAQARFALRGIERLHQAGAGGMKVELGCIPRAMYTLMPRLLERVHSETAAGALLQRGTAGVGLNVTEDSSSALLDSLVRGALDFAILRSTSGRVGLPEELVMERLYDDRLVVICAAKNPEFPEAPIPLGGLAGHGWVLPRPQTTSREAFDRFWAEHALAPVRPVIEVRSFETNLALVAGTRFLSIAPESIARRHAAHGALRVLQVRPALPSSPVMLAFRRSIEESAMLHRFRRLVHDTAAAARAELRTSEKRA